MNRRDPLTWAAVGLAVVAFAGSFDHVRSVVADHGQPGWLSVAIALMPEVSVVLAVLKIRRARHTGEPTGPAWVVGGSAAAFTIGANIATAEPSVWGVIVAAWPAWASLGAASLIEMNRPTVRSRAVHKPAKRAPEPAAAAAQTVLPAKQPAREPSGVDDLLLVGQAVAEQLAHEGQRLTRAALVEGIRAHGRSVSNARAGELLERLRAA